MEDPLKKGDFIMKIYIEKEGSYLLFKRIVALSFISLFIIGFLGAAAFKIIEVKADSSSEYDNNYYSLVSTGENSLIGVSSPFNPTRIKKVKVIITGYSSTSWQTDETPFITASGKWVEDGIVANNMLPFGTEIRIPELYGDKIFVVEDRMAAKKGYYHVDVWFDNYYEAKDFGAKITYIEIIES